MKVKSNKKYKEELIEHRKRFSSQKQFPAFPSPYTNRLVPIMHGGYLMFIRSKFLFLGLLNSLEQRNLFAAWVLLKAYWENVAAFAYYYVRISEFIEKNDIEAAFELSRKMALGGRKFLTKEMVEKKGRMEKDFFIPDVSAMLNTTDNDWKRSSGNTLGFKEFYDTQIAEGGHTTYMGLSISGKWTKDRALIPHVKRSWSKDDNKAILNFTSMGSLVFFYYWNKFLEIDKKS